MAVPHVQTNFADVLDPRFQHFFWEEYRENPDRVGEIFGMAPDNGRDTIRYSQIGTVPDFVEFTGSVNYGSYNQGYNTTLTWTEFARGIQAERKLVENDQTNILDGRPKGLAKAAFRTRQVHAAGLFNKSFSNNTDFSNSPEGLALCSNSHTTTSGASTASGFDNLTTAALSATAVAAARIQMRGFRGDQAERISIQPTDLWHPPDRFEEAYEIIASSGKVDGDLNNANVHQGKYTTHDLEYLTDTNDWWMTDGGMQKQSAIWWDRIGLEFAFAEDFNTMVGKWRAYMGYAYGHVDWRWISGANVS